MGEKDDDFKIYNLLKKFQKFYNNNFLVVTEKQQKLNFDMNFGTFCHLVGLHYCNKDKKNGVIIGKKILNKKLNDKKIFNIIKNTNFSKGISYVAERTNNINYFLENLDKGILVNSNNNENSKINSTNFILQTQDKNYLELGLVNKFEDEYYLETFLIRKNDKNIDYTLKNKILEIYIEDENLNFNRFSFHSGKQKILDKSPQLSYKECMELYYRNIGITCASISEGIIKEIKKANSQKEVNITQEKEKTKGWDSRIKQEKGLGIGD